MLFRSHLASGWAYVEVDCVVVAARLESHKLGPDHRAPVSCRDHVIGDRAYNQPLPLGVDEMASTGRKSAADRDLRFLRLDHFTVPVRDLNVAREFYCGVLGGAVVAEAD